MDRDAGKIVNPHNNRRLDGDARRNSMTKSPLHDNLNERIDDLDEIGDRLVSIEVFLGNFNRRILEFNIG